MAFKKTFVVSDETENSYHFIVRTAGIKLEKARKNCPCFYSHNRRELPLGHWENFRIENTKLLADLVIDGESDLEKTYIRKIENGDIKGATIGADPITWNTDGPVLICEECELFEISLEALPGNSNALALKKGSEIITLSAENAHTVLPQLNQNTDMKSIALKLGLPEAATEAEMLNAIGVLQLNKATSDKVVENLLKGAEEGLDADQKETFVELSKSNPTLALKYAEKAKATATTESATTAAGTVNVVKDVKVSTLLRKGDGKQADAVAEDGKNSFDYLQKHNPVELARIRKEDNAKYMELARAYEGGLRYTGK